MEEPVTLESLIAAALRARQNAHAPYSNFLVGAALEGIFEEGDRRTFTGCNVENATYGLTVCAERVAVFNAVSAGVLKAQSTGGPRFPRIAIVADTDTLTPPCGACRQILWEFCGDLELILANLSGKRETLRLSEIFPRPFDGSFL